MMRWAQTEQSVACWGCAVLEWMCGAHLGTFDCCHSTTIVGLQVRHTLFRNCTNDRDKDRDNVVVESYCVQFI